MKALVLLPIALLALGDVALAHGGHDDRVKVHLSKHELRLEMSVEAGTLSSFDTDGDGVLRVAEFVAQKERIATWVDEGISLVGATDHAYAASFADTPIEGFADLGPQDPVAHLKLVRRYPLLGSENALRLDLAPALRGPGARSFVVWTAPGADRALLKVPSL